MGLSPFKRSSVCGYAAPAAGNPNPNKFKILKTEQVGKFLIAKIQYPDATNYEGVKVLVFEGVSDLLLRSSKKIDPHFCDGSHLSPIARFEPTEKGWELAKRICLG